MKKIAYLPRKIATFAIIGYQKLLSPDHSWLKFRYPHGFCKFYPSCSEYTKQAIEKFGVVKGSYLGIKRIIRCNPWTKPGIDLVPN
jgi:putative membrane protein insertion efficiency factor